MSRSILGRPARDGLWYVPAVLAVLVVVVLVIVNDDFAGRRNLLNLSAQLTPLLIVSLGQLLVVLVRGLDLSVGAVMSLSTAIVVSGLPTPLAIGAVLIVSGLIGAINGLVIVRFNVHPIIATLSMTSLVQGLVLLLRPVAGGRLPDGLAWLVSGELFGIYLPLAWIALALIVAWKLVHGSRYGLHLFAIGGGDAARSFGVPTARVSVLAYVACSMFAGAAGIFLAGRIGSGDPNVGALFAIDSITAVSLGGVQLAGGVGSVQGTVFGAILLSLLSNAMNLQHVSPFVQTAVKGGLLLLVIALQPRKTIGL